MGTLLDEITAIFEAEETTKRKKRKRHRLRDVQVREVSLVDKGAVPESRYVIMKRDTPDPDAELIEEVGRRLREREVIRAFESLSKTADRCMASLSRSDLERAYRQATPHERQAFVERLGHVRRRLDCAELQARQIGRRR